MEIIYSGKHQLHDPRFEICDGKTVEIFESPQRALSVLEEVKMRKFGKVIEPETFSRETFYTVHSRRYIEFLERAWDLWKKEGNEGNATGYSYNTLYPKEREPRTIQGLLGMYTSDGAVPITPTSWQAIETSAFVALTGAKLIKNGEQTAFSLCRPPGHHASRENAAGYCYINNAALAAQSLIETGASKIAILDIDYHHGNGTQDIFYDRSDVLFASLHANPADDYPYFIGYTDETGRGEGEGFNFNYSLELFSDYSSYGKALDDACRNIGKHSPDVLVVSLGVDTFEKDPISHLRLKSEDYLSIGRKIASVKLPTLFIMEGGYAIDEIGVNVANVLEGFNNG